MRYTVLTFRTFHNRITKDLGVLVGAALIATLGLPSASQAQTIDDAPDGVVFADSGDRGFTVNWMTRLAVPADNAGNWIVTFTPPGSSAVVVDQHTTNVRGIEDATPLGTWADARSFTYDRNEVGTWWFQVSACLVDFDYTDDPDEIRNSCPSGELEKGASVGYTHGAWTAPMNFGATNVPGGVALTWTSEEDDHGLATYQYSMDDGKKWTNAGTSGSKVVSDVKPGEHTFMLRALSRSDNSTSTGENEYGTGAEAAGAAASKTITVPMPTPTLPEIAALFLAMLLLGSGAYLLRRRQSGGLTPA